MNIYDKVLRYGLYGYLEGTDRQDDGDVWFVDGNSGNAANSAGTGQGASWDLPFSTVNYAISRCSNNAGDVIFIKADHTETIADTNDDNVSGTTTDEFCVDKAGVTIIGLGSGTRRPTFTLATATDACIDVRAANCVIYNLIFYNTVDGNATMLSAQAGADGLILENCMFYESANDAEPIRQVNIVANCDDVTIRGCRFYNVAGGDQILSAIDLVGATTRTKIIDCVFRGDWNEHVIDGDAAAGFDVEIMDNFILNSDAGVGSVIDLNDSTTGVVSGNTVHGAAGTSGSAIIAKACLVSNNYVTVNEGQNAKLWPGNIGGTGVGNHWYVDSGVGTALGTGLSWADATATIEQAIQLCTASNGDVIHVAAGHNEKLTGLTVYICDIDVNGIHILGEGSGASRPLIECNTVTNGVVELSSNDVTIENIRFASDDADDMEYLIRVDGTNCTIKNCSFEEGVEEALTCITVGVATDALANGLTVDGCDFITISADDQNSAISIIKDMKDVTIKNCFFRGDWDEGCVDIVANGDACTNLLIENNVMINLQTGDHCIQISGVTCTGLIANNTFICDTRDQAAQPSLCQMVNNKWSKLGTGMVGMDNVDPVNAGIHIFVDSGATGAGTTAGHGYSWDEPLSTLDSAMALCTASSGDIIHLAPGHAEDVATAGAITCDIAGVHILGHGTGADRPTFTFITNNGADIEIDAANVTFENIIFVGNKDGLTGPLDVDAAGVSFIRCDFIDTAGNTNVIDWIVGDANADNLLVEECVNIGTNTAGDASWIQVDGCDRLTVKNCRSHGDFSVANIGVVNTAITHCLITGNHLTNLNGVDVNIEVFAASTGQISKNYCEVPSDAQVTWINTAGACTLYENYGANQDGETGMICGTASQ